MPYYMCTRLHPSFSATQLVVLVILREYTKHSLLNFPLMQSFTKYDVLVCFINCRICPLCSFLRAQVFGSNLSPLEPDMTEAILEALPTKK